MSKSLNKEQIEAAFAKFDSNEVLKLLHIDIAHKRVNETQFHEGLETEQGGFQELEGKQKIINSEVFARYPEQLVRIFEDRCHMELDKAPRPPIRRVIWILASYTVFFNSTNIYSHIEMAMLSTWNKSRESMVNSTFLLITNNAQHLGCFP